MKADVIDCVDIREAAGWASAAYDDVPPRTKKTLNKKGVAAQTYYMHKGVDQKDGLWRLRCLEKLSKK